MEIAATVSVNMVTATLALAVALTNFYTVKTKIYGLIGNAIVHQPANP